MSLLIFLGVIIFGGLIGPVLLHLINQKKYVAYERAISDEEIDKLLNAQIDTHENKAFNYVYSGDSLPLGRVSAFLNNFGRTTYDEEPYAFYCKRSSRDNEFREYGCVITRTGVYVSKENPQNKDLKENDPTVLMGKDSVIDFSGLTCVVVLGPCILTVNHKPNSIIDRFHFCVIEEASLRNSIKKVCKTVIRSGYNFSLQKGITGESVEEDSYEYEYATYEGFNQEEVEKNESDTEQFAEGERKIESKPVKPMAVAAGIQAVKPGMKKIWGEVKNHMNAARGNGYAAEYGNNTVDRALGKRVKNAAQELDSHGKQVKDGPDRIVNGVEIQTKYCKNASETIGAAFDKDNARYIRQDGSGKMMAIEVPRDQYNDAVELMQKRIDEGRVPNVSPGEDARNYVRRGFFTYEQSCNIARAGTIESLTVDAVSGALCCVAAAGISSVIVFAISVWKGNLSKEAFKQCIGTSIGIIGKGTLIYTLTMQLSRKEIALIFAGKAYNADGVAKGFKAVTNPVYEASNKIVEKITGSGLAATKAGKKLGLDALTERQVIGGVVTATVVFGPDLVRALQGKISTKQLLKNYAIAAAGMAGAAKAQAMVPVPIVPAIVGGVVAGAATKKVLDHFIEDDAKEMFRILKEEFIDMTMLIGLNEEELNEVSELTVQSKKLTKMLQNMFKADDCRQYARIEIMQSAIIKVTKKRKHITKKEYKQGLIDFMAEAV